jgi:hypothetical protein
MRNIQTFGKLASAVISSITDVGTYVITTGYNKLPYWDAIATRQGGRQQGHARLPDHARDHRRVDDRRPEPLDRRQHQADWSGMLAQSTMKLSLMNAWTDTLRRAFSLTMMQGLARLSKTEWGKLTEWDRTLMERAGITRPTDWA